MSLIPDSPESPPMEEDVEKSSTATISFSPEPGASPRKRSFESMVTEEGPLFIFQNFNMGRDSLLCMAKCLKTRFLCDVELMASGNIIIAAHKLVLIAASKYFASVFKDYQESQEKIVYVDNVDGDTLKILVDYCYTGRIEIKKENVVSLLESADRLALRGVVQGCCNFLNKTMSTQNCFNLAAFASSHNVTALEKGTQEYICQNFMEISNSLQFLAMNKEELFALLSSDKLVAPDEDSIYKRVKTWVMHNYAERVNMKEILNLLHLRLVSSFYLFDIVQLFTDACKTTNLMAALEERVIHQNMQMLNDPNELTRIYIHDRLMVIGGSDGNNAGYVEIYDAITNKWSDIVNTSSLLLNKKWFGAVAIKSYKQNNQILIMGGLETDACKSVQLLDLNAKTLRNIAPMKHARYYLGAAGVRKEHNYYVYAMGGQEGNEFVSYVEKWDIVSQTWYDVAPLIMGRAGFGTAILKDKIYVAGGLTRLHEDLLCTNSMEALSLETETWQLCAPMFCLRGNACLIAAGDVVYALGGRCDMEKCLSSVEQYDPVTNVWTLFTSLPTPRRDLAGCYRRNKLHICGGISEGEITSHDVYQYDLPTRTWEKLAPLNHNRMAASLIHLPYFH